MLSWEDCQTLSQTQCQWRNVLLRKMILFLPLLLHTALFGIVTNGDTTIYGVRCLTACKRGDSGYYFCHTGIMGRGRNAHDLDYCSTSSKLTRYGEKCKDTCRVSKYGYSWCYTESSWDYCSLSSSGGGRSIHGGKQNVRVGHRYLPSSATTSTLAEVILVLCASLCHTFVLMGYKADTALCKK